MKRVVLIYNPQAGNGIFTAHLDKVIARFADAGMLLIPIRLGGAFTLERVMTDPELSRCHKFIAAGGDGTVHLVVNEMVKHGVETPLAIFPAGTANDLASYLGVPSEIDGMVEVALSENYLKMDVGTANGRCFVNVLAIGMLVDISQRTDPTIKNTLGLGAYYLRGLAEVPFARASHIRIIAGDKVIDGDSSAVIIMNGRQAGGFHQIAPFSDIGDGLLDVVYFKKLILPVMLPVLLTVMAGQHPRDKRVEYFKAAQLRIETDEQHPVNTDLDGERGDVLPLDVGVLPGRILVNAPPDAE
ncbi:MAG: YegS/Rv2252/BmrU family lipid kinase [Clostridiales Family XIII bacterium]|jgi:YegS/Rv2252/BmrU family lipid kinase|nr:YegS/Rv2252/BmrU family lipid kinase [Clostridiales Family XIII bacterium]